MDIEKAFAAGIIATLIFGIIFLGYSYMKASEPSLLSMVLRLSGGNVFGIAVLYSYNWIGSASLVPPPFTPVEWPTLVPTGALLLAGTEDGSAVRLLLSTFQFDNSIYYALAVVSALIGGFVAFESRKKSFSEAALAAVIPATMIVLFTVIVNMVIATLVPPGIKIGYPASAYLPIALVNYLLFALGSFGAALVKLK